MSNKTSNKALLVLFAILLLIVVITIITDSGKNERTFREELVDLDTAKVSAIYIYPKSQNHKEVKLFKEEGAWKVRLDDTRVAEAPKEKINNILDQLLKIVPKRLAARDVAKWTEYQVDSTGTRIKVEENGKEVLNLILGRFSFQQPRSMSTYVRLDKDTDVYEVDGFLDMTFNKDANAFRNGILMKDDTQKWQRLVFEYPADSSFQIVKNDGKWFYNDIQLDSAKTINYLKKISNLNSSDYSDIPGDIFSLNTNFKLHIDSSDSTSIVISAVKDSSNFVINSSMNPETYFDGNKSQLGSKIFIGLNSLRN